MKGRFSRPRLTWIKIEYFILALPRGHKPRNEAAHIKKARNLLDSHVTQPETRKL